MANMEEERLVCLIAQSMLLGVPAQQVCLHHPKYGSIRSDTRTFQRSFACV
jgi:hypothetical protein